MLGRVEVDGEFAVFIACDTERSVVELLDALIPGRYTLTLESAVFLLHQQLRVEHLSTLMRLIRCASEAAAIKANLSGLARSSRFEELLQSSAKEELTDETCSAVVTELLADLHSFCFVRNLALPELLERARKLFEAELEALSPSQAIDAIGKLFEAEAERAGSEDVSDPGS